MLVLSAAVLESGLAEVSRNVEKDGARWGSPRREEEHEVRGRVRGLPANHANIANEEKMA